MDANTRPWAKVRLPAVDLIDLAELTQALERFLADANSSMAVVDLTAGGPGRCTLSSGISDVNRWERALRRLETSSIPTLALMSGRLSGASLEVALGCDLRIAAPNTVLAWTNDGAVWPGTVLYRLAQLIGPGPARRLVLLAQELSMDEARAAGLVDVVTADVDGELSRLGSLVAELSDVRVVRQLIGEAAHTGYDEALGAHLAACDRYLRRNGMA